MKKYGITGRKTLYQLKLEVVPAGRARSYGLDSSMVMA